jgi:magnesium chelatase family protein
MTVRISTVAFQGIEAVPVEVEVQKTRGLFGQVSMVGLPSHGVRESRDRVRAAVQASRFTFPKSALIINFAPADLRKEGSFYDLPVALGILAAHGIIPLDSLRGYIVLGELALDGSLRAVPGTLSAAILTRESGRRGIVVPPANRDEARLVPGIEVLTSGSLRNLSRLFGAVLGGGPGDGHDDDQADREPEGRRPRGWQRQRNGALFEDSDTPPLDYSDVVGQESAKEALITAAAGGHNLLMIGPPGSGKTMLAARLPSILPDLDIKASLEVSRIHSFMARGLNDLIVKPPFRAPHHTVSYAGLVGGGQVPRPGEISLAHRGVLFMDELPEFDRRTLETLRQPMEEGVITISRVGGSVTIPARICLIASMNPCPCGFSGDGRCHCVCTPRQVQRYLNRISGPLLDRLDMHIEVPPVPIELLKTGGSGLSSEEMAARVRKARECQYERWRSEPFRLNAHIPAGRIRSLCELSAKASRFLDEHLARFPLSARGYARILKVSRTLADLDGSSRLELNHIERSVMFRSLDRLLPSPPGSGQGRQGSSTMA